MTQTASNYARALYELGFTQKEVEETAKSVLSSPELYEALTSPAVSPSQKQAVIRRLYTGRQARFLGVLCRHGQAALLEQIGEAFADYVRAQQGVLAATLFYVTAPDTATQQKMKALLQKKYHAEQVLLKLEQKPELIGGFVLRCGDSVYDWSLSGRVQRMKQTLTRR